jgi:hypothetical protein
VRYPNRSVRPPPLSGVSDSHTSRDLPLGNLDVLACEEARFHGTAAGSEHRECGAQCSELDERPRICGMRTRSVQPRSGDCSCRMQT